MRSAPGGLVEVDPHKLGAEPHKLAAEPPKLSAEPHKLSADPHKLDGPPSELDPRTELPAELRSRLDALGKRPPRGEFEDLLVALCAWQPSGARELAMWLNGRDPREPTRAYLRRMVADGRLVHTFPQMPNHPDQQYAVPAAAERVSVSDEALRR